MTLQGNILKISSKGFPRWGIYSDIFDKNISFTFISKYSVIIYCQGPIGKAAHSEFNNIYSYSSLVIILKVNKMNI